MLLHATLKLLFEFSIIVLRRYYCWVFDILDPWFRPLPRVGKNVKCVNEGTIFRFFDQKCLVYLLIFYLYLCLAVTKPTLGEDQPKGHLGSSSLHFLSNYQGEARSCLKHSKVSLRKTIHWVSFIQLFLNSWTGIWFLH